MYCERALGRFHNCSIGNADGTTRAGQSLAAWSYRTADAAATVETAGYFNAARAVLQVGDTIVAVVGIGGTMKAKNYVVTAVPASGDVTIGLFATTAG